MLQPTTLLINDPVIIKGLLDGTFVRYGSVIRYAAGTGKGGQIFKHLTEVPGTIDPLTSYPSLFGIEKTLDSVMGLTQIAAGASVLNLGVSIAGFAYMGFKLHISNAKGIKYWTISSEISGNADKLKAEQQKLESEFDSKNVTFQEAINNMKISIHPILYELKELFHELDNIPLIPKKVTTDTDNVHSALIIELFQEADYRANLPLEYHCFLEYLIENYSQSESQRLFIKKW